MALKALINLLLSRVKVLKCSRLTMMSFSLWVRKVRSLSKFPKVLLLTQRNFWNSQPPLRNRRSKRIAAVCAERRQIDLALLSKRSCRSMLLIRLLKDLALIILQDYPCCIWNQLRRTLNVIFLRSLDLLCMCRYVKKGNSILCWVPWSLVHYVVCIVLVVMMRRRKHQQQWLENRK